jgi:glycosyltransferase involved in cell wall biosynthesis
MKVLHALNYHRAAWGSDQAWEKTIRLSAESGMEVAVFSRDSKALPSGLAGKAKAFVSGLYAAEGIRGFVETLDSFKPEIVQTHELYPLITPWILPRCREAGIPVVHTVYDYRLSCPIATHFTHGQVCRKCAGGREYWAVRNNCRGNLPESVGYALRNAVGRQARLFIDNVAQFVVPTDFSRHWLSREIGIDDARITTQPCIIPLPDTAADPAQGQYIAFAGRFTVEKGSQLLIAAARLAGLPVRLAGNAETHPDIRPGDPVTCVVTRSPAELAEFYRGARLLVVPSLWEETFGVVAAEAMSHGIPVIAARIGALPYTVTENVAGLLFDPGNAGDLAATMRRLWDDPALCRTLGAAGRRKVATEFDAASHIRHLRTAYDRALGGNPDISEAIHQSAAMLHKVGALDEPTMADFDARHGAQ